MELSYLIMKKGSPGRLAAEVFRRVGPEQVAHRPVLRRLLEPIDLVDVLQLVDLGGQAPVDAEELFVHESGQGQAVESLHAGVVHGQGVLDNALLLEREVVGEVAALVVAT